MRLASPGHSCVGKSKWLPRLSSVLCLTLLPTRNVRTNARTAQLLRFGLGLGHVGTVDPLHGLFGLHAGQLVQVLEYVSGVSGINDPTTCQFARKGRRSANFL